MKFYLIYVPIVFLRFIIHLNTQPGYIHPDEFFQTIEISAEDVLKYEVLKPWEFNSTSLPIRSRAIIELFLNLPLRFYLQSRLILSRLVRIPFDLLTFTRLWTTFCSLSVDVSIFVQSLQFGIDHKSALFLHSSSHVSLVFLSRTLSNVWETQLLSLFVLVAMIIKTTDRNNNRIVTSSELLQGAIIAIGFFCRPTFLAFVLPYVLMRLIDLRCSRSRVYRYGLHGLIGFLSVAVVLIGIDTAAYSSSSSSSSSNLDLVVTPLNFIRYNSNTANLAQHGRHSWFLHVLVNIPLLIGPALLLLLVPLVTRRPCKTTHHPVLLASLLVPIVFLSLFPHQEMRFLLPICPAALLLVAANLNGKSLLTKLILLLHVLFNLLSIVFWGYLHQGSVLSAATVIQRHVAATTTTTNDVCHLVITYKSFMMPKFPFAVEQQATHCTNQSIISVHNLVGLENESQFWERVTQLKREMISPAVLHLIYPKAYRFKEKENFAKLGKLKSIYTIPGHINTDLWPPEGSIYDFLCLQYLMFSF